MPQQANADRTGHPVALVTGASRGIGAAVARLLAEAGADVVINYRSKGPRAQMGLLWALGRGAPIDGPRLLEHLGYLRTTAAWLDQHGRTLTKLAAQTLTVTGGQ